MEVLEMRNIIDLQWRMVTMVVAMVPDPREMRSMCMHASDLLKHVAKTKTTDPNPP